MKDLVKDKIDSIFEVLATVFFTTISCILLFGLMFITIAFCISIYYGV